MTSIGIGKIKEDKKFDLSYDECYTSTGKKDVVLCLEDG